jgi:hypothetical protein
MWMIIDLQSRPVKTISGIVWLQTVSLRGRDIIEFQTEEGGHGQLEVQNHDLILIRRVA